MKTKSKKILSVFAAAMLLTACNHKSEPSSGVDSMTTSTKEQQTNISSTSMHSASDSLDNISSDESVVPNENVITFDIESVQDYSDDVAWVEISKKENDVVVESQWACIDKTGNVLFMLDADLYTTPNAFEKDVALCETMDNVYNFIDKSGNVVFSSQDGFFDGVVSPFGEVACGDGYFAVYKYQESFDTRGYEVFFLNEKGEQVTEYNRFLDHYPTDMIYCGDGVFAINHRSSGNGDKGYDFISLKNDKYFQVNGIYGNYDLSNIFINGVGLLEMGSVLSNPSFSLVYEDGTIENLDKDHSYFYEHGKIAEDGIIFSKYYQKVDSVFFYDIITGKVTLLGDYGERVNIKRLEDLYFDNGRMLLPLVGADWKNYYTIIDKFGQSLFDPIICKDVYALNEDRIMVKFDDKTVIINGNGETIFELPLNCEIAPYRSGMSQIIGEERSVFIDTEGNVVSVDDILYAVEEYLSKK